MAHTGVRAKRTTGRPGRFSLSNWPVAGRLVVVFAVASLAGLALGGLRVSDAISNAHADGQTAQLAILGKQATVLVHAIEDERDTYAGVAAYNVLASDAATNKAAPAVANPIQAMLRQANAELTTAEGNTDTEAQRTESLANAVGAEFPAGVQAGAQNALATTDGIQAMRSSVVGQPASDVIASYSASLGGIFPLVDQITSTSGDPELASDVRALGMLSRAEDQMSQQRAILYAALLEASVNDAGGGKRAPFNTIGNQALTGAGGLIALTTAQGLQAAFLTDFYSAASPALSNTFMSTVAGQPDSFTTLIENFVTQPSDPRLTFEQMDGQPSLGLTRASIAPTWYSDATAKISQIRSVESQLAATIVARSQALQRQSTDSAVLTAAATAGVVLLMLVATALIGRTLVNPLRRLQADALEIATKRLPERVAAAASSAGFSETSAMVEPIGVRSTDEIGRVARAFDQVHAEAVRLAGNEAQLRGSLNTMFISLSRRSVPLIDRLARMIDTMEQEEDDPDQLADLFAMDHLVTRMRRNSENLLVLAGEEPVRKWTESVSLTDVARAAASEIEQYNRVALAVQPGIMISGQAAADVVHLLAELIENATLFSPQNTQVRITVMGLSSGGVLIEVRDDGVGISVLRLADINWRLDHPPVVDVSISRHMGLYAVSRLAARHGIKVRLRPGTPQGLSALVWLPGHLARKEPGHQADGHSRPTGADLMAWARTTAATRYGTRHRNGPRRASGWQPALAGRGAPAGRPGTVWFTAKRPSGDGATPAGEVAAAQQAAGQQAANGHAASGDPAGTAPAPRAADDFRGFPGREGFADREELTGSGLPRRVPRTNGFPRADAPGIGFPVTATAATAPVLGAPPDNPADWRVMPEARHEDVPEARRHEQALRRRSPEAARSRLSGFQLGSRDAIQAGKGGSQGQHAGEENSR